MNDRASSSLNNPNAPGVGQSDSSFGSDVPLAPKAKTVSRLPPAKFVVMREAQMLEPLRANNREEADETVTRQVRAAKTPVVYIYQLVGAVMYEPSSVMLTPDEIETKLGNGNSSPEL